MQKRTLAGWALSLSYVAWLVPWSVVWFLTQLTNTSKKHISNPQQQTEAQNVDSFQVNHIPGLLVLILWHGIVHVFHQNGPHRDRLLGCSTLRVIFHFFIYSVVLKEHRSSKVRKKSNRKEIYNNPPLQTSHTLPSRQWSEPQMYIYIWNGLFIPKGVKTDFNSINSESLPIILDGSIPRGENRSLYTLWPICCDYHYQRCSLSLFLFNCLCM